MKDDLALSTTEAGEPGESERATASAAKPSKTDWASELRGILWLILAVLGFHTFIAKPFYIPSESMLPGLLVGDQLVVSKFPYGWSFVSPTFHVFAVPSWPLAWAAARAGRCRDRHAAGYRDRLYQAAHRFAGRPHRGARRIVILNGVPLKRGPLHYVDIPNYGGAPLVSEPGVTCDPLQYPGALHTGADGKSYCRLPLYTETLPNGRHYETVDLGPSPGDNYPETLIPPGHVFLMGDNRDRSADSRFSLAEQGLGGPVPWEYLGGRAEFITFSKTGLGSWNPLTWGQSFRGGRAGTSLHAERDK